MNPGHIIFVFVLLYSTLFAINTNSLEKKMLYTVLQRYRLVDYNSSFGST